MADLDPEIVERAVRWCAESGRPVGAEVVRAVLAPLGWDELLAVKATLADPPPRAGLSPADLVALSRGGDPPQARSAGVAAAGASRRTPRGSRTVARAPAGPRIRRARDRVEPRAPSASALPQLDDLYRESGRAILGRLLRRHGANRAATLAALAAGWVVGEAAPSPADLDRLLEHHGLARGFAERERALLLHALRKHGGVIARVARDLGTDAATVRGALDRLSLGGPAESIREARRRAIERKGTLAERARLIDEDEEALADLGILARVEQDLRRRLPEQLRALAVGGRRPNAADLGRSLSLSRGAVDRLVARFGLPLRPAPPEREGRASSGVRRGPPGAGRGPGPARRPRPASAPRPRR